MDSGDFVNELFKAYHLDSIVDSVKNVSIGVPSKTVLLLSCILLYPLGKAIYNIYFHPLSKFPGPIFAKATKIPVALVSWDGSVSQWMHELHNCYHSDIVRISPDELSFIAPSAWKDIYGLRPGHSEFPKDLSVFKGAGSSILTANDADHSRIRKLLSHGFSDKALREQESLLQTYVHNLISGLRNRVKLQGGKANVVEWFNWTTFDIISDLSFGESFDCLQNNDYHPWVRMVMGIIKSFSYLHVVSRFPPLDKVLSLYKPKKFVKDLDDHRRLVKEKLERRMKVETTRPDFVAYALRHRDDEKGGMTDAELRGNMSTLISAGSETTATQISGAMWYLLTNPHCLEQVNEEVRGTFRRAEDIKMKTIIDELPYLEAVIKETFRMYPAGLGMQPRIAPKGGDTVSGRYIPEGTKTKLNQFAANHSWLNFNSPETFAPSRWLGNEHFKDDKRDVVQPFGVGVRNCIGKNLAMAEIRLILANLLWTFDMELAEETDEEWAEQKAWGTWEKKPLIVKMTERKV